jgi:SAM-dependent methyltransferase
MVAIQRAQRSFETSVGDENGAILDVAALWRCESIVRLGLEGESLIAAASPGVAFPQMLDFLVRNVEVAPLGTIIDIGAGLAGIAETVRRASGRSVLAFDASRHACAGAHTLFPDVQMAQADPSRLPARDGSIAAAISCGLLTTLADPEAIMSEVRRVIEDEGRFVVVDLASASSSSVRAGDKVFSSVERIHGSLSDSGFELVDQAIGLTTLSDWALADADIARDIAAHRRGRAEFEYWLDDRRRFERMMSSNRVMTVGVAVRPC